MKVLYMCHKRVLQHWRTVFATAIILSLAHVYIAVMQSATTPRHGAQQRAMGSLEIERKEEAVVEECGNRKKDGGGFREDGEGRSEAE